MDSSQTGEWHQLPLKTDSFTLWSSDVWTVVAAQSHFCFFRVAEMLQADHGSSWNRTECELQWWSDTLSYLTTVFVNRWTSSRRPSCGVNQKHQLSRELKGLFLISCRYDVLQGQRSSSDGDSSSVSDLAVVVADFRRRTLKSPNF